MWKTFICGRLFEQKQKNKVKKEPINVKIVNHTLVEFSSTVSRLESFDTTKFSNPRLQLQQFFFDKGTTTDGCVVNFSGNNVFKIVFEDGIRKFSKVQSYDWNVPASNLISNSKNISNKYSFHDIKACFNL